MLGAMLIITIVAVREVMSYLRRRDEYKLRRLTLRLSMAGMMLFLLASIYAGITWFGLADPVGFDKYWIAFWAFVTMLTFAIFCLVVADLRAITEEKESAALGLWREMGEMLAEHERRKQEQQDGDHDA